MPMCGRMQSLAGKALFLGFVFFLAGALVSGCSKSQDKQPPANAEPAAANAEAAKPDFKALSAKADIENGKKIYVQYCHFCHGLKGLGDGPVGIAITPHPADFVNDTKRMSKTDEELYKSITDGIKKEIGGDAMHMPRWKEILSEQERWDVLTYIRRLSKEGAQP